MNDSTAADPGPPTQRWQERLRNGRNVVIRPLTRVDAAREREFIESLSPETLRFRFLGLVHRPSEKLIAQLTDLDPRRDVAFAAVVADDADERILGSARYSATEDGTRCECAVTVLDELPYETLIFGMDALLVAGFPEISVATGGSAP